MIKLDIMTLIPNEYSRLCTEIDANSNRIFTVLGIIFAAFSAIFGFGIDKQNSVFIICALIPMIPGLFIIASQYNSTNRIKTYLIIFYEDEDSKVKWETRLRELRKSRFYKSNYHLAIKISILSVFGISILYSQLYFWKSFTCDKFCDFEFVAFFIMFIVLSLLISIGFLIGYIEVLKCNRNSEFFDNYWENIKQNSRANT